MNQIDMTHTKALQQSMFNLFAEINSVFSSVKRFCYS